MSLEVFIPTYKRVDRQLTFRFLPPEWQERTLLVCYPEEADDLEALGYPVLVCEGVRGIAAKRQWIIEQASGPILMLDDDLRFDRRREDDTSKFLVATPEDVGAALKTVEYLLEHEYVHVSIAAREGGNRIQDPYIFNSRYTRALGYRADVLREKGLRLDRLQYMEDFDMNLQLLRRGYESATINWMVQGQGGANVSGGCLAAGRDPFTQAEAAAGLKELHPEFVKVVTKRTKHGWGGGFSQDRVDVTVRWKQALASSSKRG